MLYHKWRIQYALQWMVLEAGHCRGHTLRDLVSSEFFIFEVISMLCPKRSNRLSVFRTSAQSPHVSQRTSLYGLVTVPNTLSHHSFRPFPPTCAFATFAPYSLAYRGVKSLA